ncbi:MAG TPA: glycosyltransferase [Anaerolineae bacterium]|jgi:glycosyltransferase involved in cell wall biosynthesis|nr:glycosyltransferase [Anaerolineae bacterium]
MRVLMVSKACLVGSYQTKLEAIAAFDDVELSVIVPPLWQDPAGEIHLERSHTDGYRLLVDPIRLNGHYHLHYYPKLAERLHTLAPHILHMDEEPYNLATWRAVRQAKQAGIKSIFFSWQNIKREYPWPFSRLERQVLAMVDHAIAGNEASASIWRDKGYRGRMEIIPQFGIEPGLFRPPPNRDDGRVFTIGSAGRRLVPEKGVDLLLRAAAGLPGIWRVLIAGEGPERSVLEQLAGQLGISERVQFDGAIPSDQMPAYLGQLDVLVMPSRTLPNWKEQFGRVLIEAMACGAVVVGSDSGEIPNVIGDAGLVFPEDDAAALTAHLLAVMSDETIRASLSEAGQQRVLANYTQEQVAARTVGVYREMLADA